MNRQRVPPRNSRRNAPVIISHAGASSTKSSSDMIVIENQSVIENTMVSAVFLIHDLAFRYNRLCNAESNNHDRCEGFRPR